MTPALRAAIVRDLCELLAHGKPQDGVARAKELDRLARECEAAPPAPPADAEDAVTEEQVNEVVTGILVSKRGWLTETARNYATAKREYEWIKDIKDDVRAAIAYAVTLHAPALAEARAEAERLRDECRHWEYELAKAASERARLRANLDLAKRRVSNLESEVKGIYEGGGSRDRPQIGARGEPSDDDQMTASWIALSVSGITLDAQERLKDRIAKALASRRQSPTPALDIEGLMWRLRQAFNTDLAKDHEEFPVEQWTDLGRARWRRVAEAAQAAGVGVGLPAGLRERLRLLDMVSVCGGETRLPPQQFGVVVDLLRWARSLPTQPPRPTLGELVEIGREAYEEWHAAVSADEAASSTSSTAIIEAIAKAVLAGGVA